jgi:hypothetical protein
MDFVLYLCTAKDSDYSNSPTPEPTLELITHSSRAVNTAMFVLVAVVWCCLLTCVSILVYTLCFWCVVGHWCCQGRVLRRNQQGDDITIVFPNRSTTIPSVEFRSISLSASEQSDQNTQQCSICLSEIEQETLVKQLACQHCYHSGCIDNWLERSSLCPLCRQWAYPKEGTIGSGMVLSDTTSDVDADEAKEDHGDG